MAPVAAILVAAQSHLPFALILFTIANATDFFDGYFARKFNATTALGAFLDPLADKVLVLCLLFSFYTLGAIKLWILLVIAFRDVVVTFLRIMALTQGYELATSKLAKLKTTFQFAVIYLLFLLASQKLGDTWYIVIENMMYAIVAFTAWTGVSYVVTNRQIIKKIF